MGTTPPSAVRWVAMPSREPDLHVEPASEVSHNYSVCAIIASCEPPPKILRYGADCRLVRFESAGMSSLAGAVYRVRTRGHKVRPRLVERLARFNARKVFSAASYLALWSAGLSIVTPAVPALSTGMPHLAAFDGQSIAGRYV